MTSLVATKCFFEKNNNRNHNLCRETQSYYNRGMPEVNNEEVPTNSDRLIADKIKTKRKWSSVKVSFVQLLEFLQCPREVDEQRAKHISSYRTQTRKQMQLMTASVDWKCTGVSSGAPVSPSSQPSDTQSQTDVSANTEGWSTVCTKCKNREFEITADLMPGNHAHMTRSCWSYVHTDISQIRRCRWVIYL